MAGVQELYQQLLPTKVYYNGKTKSQVTDEKRRLYAEIPWRMCSTFYLAVTLFFEVLRSLDLITKVEPWFSQVTPKPLYENEHATAFWDVPLFADTTHVKANRIDATVIDKTSKQVRVIEMSCPWLENRESKDSEKTTKYSQLRLELTNRYPEYKVNQYNIIMNVLGGCSKEVEKNIKELVGDKCESIMRQMQKAILSSSLHIARMFKLSA
ncbi:unnamed protein product [Porites evermanni]|uniref:Uncharacterized protein n=1 Tax=Porites evermanni TaxID=104178 RepID=A0ABN8LB19_9CNID|nr:unnamed protein product [Porites evermanni]